MTDRTKLMVLLIQLLQEEPVTAADLVQALGVEKRLVNKWLHALQNTEPVNLVYVCDFRYEQRGRNIITHPLYVWNFSASYRPPAVSNRSKVTNSTYYAKQLGYAESGNWAKVAPSMLAKFRKLRNRFPDMPTPLDTAP